MDLLTCCPVCGDCYDGKSMMADFNYWVREGLVTSGCMPYSIDVECGSPCAPEAYSSGEIRREAEVCGMCYAAFQPNVCGNTICKLELSQLNTS